MKTEKVVDILRNNVLASLSDMGCFGSLILSIQDTESYINIALMIISILILIINFSLRFYDRLKDGKLTKAEIKETITDVQQIKDEIDKMKRGD